jgi:hypothetical protein
MTILNRTNDGLLSVLIALQRALIAYGPQSEDKLLTLCAPRSVVPSAKPEMARRTLMRWKQLGFFQQAADQVTVHSNFVDIEADDIDSLRGALLELVLAPRNNPVLVDGLNENSNSETEGSLASDFTRAAAWVLAQDPYAFSANYDSGVDSLQVQQGVEPRPFINNTRWNGFTEWAVFLGIGWRAKGTEFIPDPAVAVRSMLNKVFGSTDELGQEIFLTRLAECLPVVDGGRYRLILEAQIARPWRLQRQNEVSPCLSAAFLHLEANGDIQLELRADAPQKILLGRNGQELRPVSHFLHSRRS